MTTISADIIQTERETLVRSLVDRLQRRGYEDLRVSRLDEFEGRRPSIIFWEGTDDGFMPDASAVKDGATYIFQVETADSIRGNLAAERLDLFCAYAGHYRRHFCLIVPEKSERETKKALMDCRLDENFVHLALV
jgi:hypothetical protein